MTEINTVVFDIGAVLLRWQPYDLLEDVFPGEGNDLFEHIIGHPQWTQLDAGLEEEHIAIADFATRTGKSEKQMHSFMQTVRQHLSPIEQSVELFKSIKLSGYKTYVLSNMPSYLMDHYRERDDFWDEFDGIMYSSQEKILKPEPEIYNRLFKKFNINPPQAVFLDDTPKNIKAAQDLGMAGIVFENAEQCQVELKKMGVN